MRIKLAGWSYFAMLLVLATACDKSVTAPVRPGPPTRLELTTGDAQSALAGTAVANPLSVTVRDSRGLAVPNATVTFSVQTGGGTVSPSTVVSNATGVAGGVTWTLGNRGGDQSATAAVDTVIKKFSATTQPGFVLDLRFFGPAMSTVAQTAFTNAANRLRAALVGPVGSLAKVSLAGAVLDSCGVKGLTGTLQESTQGVIIYASVALIDGVGKVLAQAGPCFVRNSFLPAVGVMQFDEADILTYITSGRFEAVVLHEMNHVAGLGTIWADKNLLQNPVYHYVGTDTTPVLTGSTNPRYMGTAALASCLAAGGSANHCASGVGVAVEQCGESGTADGHWREMFTATCSTQSGRSPVGGTPAFDAELMTGFVESTPSMPWSAMSIASFQDLGYTVNLLAADPFTVPSLLTLARLTAQDAVAEPHTEVVLRPRFIVGGGRMQSLSRELR